MAYDDWNRLDEEDDDELQDMSVSVPMPRATLSSTDRFSQFYEGKKDVILFAIDCSESMLEMQDDPNYEGVKTCHVLTALEAAMQIAKRKVVVGPNDAVGVMFFNTVRTSKDSVVPFIQTPWTIRRDETRVESKGQTSNKAIMCICQSPLWTQRKCNNSCAPSTVSFHPLHGKLLGLTYVFT